MKRLGLIFILIGSIISGYFLIEVYKDKKKTKQNISSVEEPVIDQNLDLDNTKNKRDKKSDEEVPVEEIKKLMSEDIDLYREGEEMAILILPRIEERHSVYWGTSDKTLNKGVGLYVSQWTVTPDYIGHVVMSGHRNTDFTSLGELKIGDLVEVKYKNTLYSYEISDIWITDPDDLTVIVDKDESVLTLTTCYPFKYLGSAPERYIVQGKLK